jgi:hypothetical protein
LARYRFEYWITPDDDEYNKLMADVQEFVDTPGHRDVMVKDIFSQEQFDDLKALMLKEGWDVAGTEARWNDDFQVKGPPRLSAVILIDPKDDAVQSLKPAIQP